MLAGWSIVLTALIYLCVLFAVAHYGDTTGRRWVNGRARPTIHALALAVFCTSWTFFGSVGLASRSGLDFLAIYIGPALVIGLCYGLVGRVVRLAKSQNITSIADFVASRYGKSERVAALVSITAVIGCVPYIALQLKAIAASLTTLLNAVEPGAMSQAVPILPVGQAASRAAIISSAVAYWSDICWWMRGVFINPGMIAFTRMPSRAYCSARPIVKLFTAAFAA